MNMKFYALFILVLILAGCYERVDDNIIAQVNNEKLSLEEFKSNFTENQWENLTTDEKRAYVQEWINLTILSQQADKQNISDRIEIKNRIKTAEKNIKANAFIAQKMSEINITEDDLFKYYKLHKSKYQTKSQEYKLQRIFIKNADKLNQVLTELKKGLKFTEAVKKYSEESLSKSGGYTGFVSKDNTDPEIWEKLYKLKKWHYDTVKTNKGYYIFRWYNTREVSIDKTFNEVRDEIINIVNKNQKEEQYRQLIDDLKLKTEKISIAI